MVSVGIPNYNKRDFVIRSVESVLAQRGIDLEVIIVDDVSTDGSFELLRDTYAGRPGLTLLRNETNLGPSATYNRALRASTGDYFIIVSADDLILSPDALRLQALAADRTSAVLVHTDWIDFDADARIIARKHFAAYEISGQAELRRLLLGNFITASTALYLRATLLAVGGFVDHLPFTSDWDVHLQVCARGPVVHLGDYLYGRTVLSSSLSANVDLEALENQSMETIERNLPNLSFESLLEYEDFHRQARAHVLLQVAQHGIRNLQFTAARARLDRAKRIYPLIARRPRFAILRAMTRFPNISRSLVASRRLPWRQISLAFLRQGG